ncbi:MAG: hypothetical protein SFV19_13310 [Rhodospirillaceae bacterium]|nr:hypothetical protein [Rhodospirillaceae bacterium]
MRNAAVAGSLYFAAVFALGFVLGTLRVLAIIPVLGETGAVVLELPIMLAASWAICGWLVKRHHVPAVTKDRLVMGGLAFALLMLAELGVSVLAFGRGVAEHFATYRALSAQLGLAAQVMFAAFPLIRYRTGAATRA